MSKSENERCVEDNECQDNLICLSGICKDPNSSLAKFVREFPGKKESGMHLSRDSATFALTCSPSSRRARNDRRACRKDENQ